ncbi:hypothetical protein QWY31_09265 [Cytophagales bacterium LB-30]|uniref:Uncharacterized protein n=1 Tax=Shiella aurantiaca TaxID=3058365 RepID=A0ABT8F5G1_9BACT|nr:hypothetical protein [Shiella aurantiaca]MDN4165691.1 hypothetical protein [Shiella aurantiaca]
MIKRIFLSFSLFLLVSGGLWAQATVKKLDKKQKENQVQELSSTPYSPSESQTAVQTKSKKRKGKKSVNAYDQLVVEYEQRMEDNVKKYNKAAKELRKPQYSDPSYFGHKRKPKKRPPGKKKFCKECQMRH